MNTWAVVWWEEGKKKLRRFPGDKPSDSGAIAFAKQLPVTKKYIYSMKKAFGPPLAKRRAPEDGMLWCPFCLSWRHFVQKAIHRDGWTTPVLWRCPICTISIKDARVRQYNPDMIIRLEGAHVKVVSEKQIRRTIRSRR
jgi:hypothetical protein